jgi:uncharacterized protein (TIGR00255 family)
MTAFSRIDAEGAWGSLSWEIRSVNHRYLEPHFKLPDGLRELEPALREVIRKKLKRGKVECALRYEQDPSANGSIDLNLDLVKEINTAANHINRILDNPAHLNAMEIMQWTGVIKTKKVDLSPLKSAALEAFERGIEVICENREREGAQLLPLIQSRLKTIEKIVDEVRAELPAILQNQSDMIHQRFKEASVDLDSERLTQEMVLLAQKSDVAEEMERLQAHVKEVELVLQQDEPVGRRLDFLMQELNREANTLSSKSIVTSTTKAAVELKVLIEQMREQIQNIE